MRRLVASIATASIRLQNDDTDGAIQRALDEGGARCGAVPRSRTAERPLSRLTLKNSGSLGWAAAVPLRLAGSVIGAVVLACTVETAEAPTGQLSTVEVLGTLIVELLAKKWAMGELKRIENEYRELIESAFVPIWGVDLNGRINE